MIKTKIKNIRILKNITPELIAGKLNISVEEYLKVENGDLDISEKNYPKLLIFCKLNRQI